MVKSLEQFVAEATQAYAPAKQAVQTQLNSLQGQLDTANEQINNNYAQQQANLNRQRNAQASSASMQAAGSGGSFGGSANLANRKYYSQSFVPAVTQMQTNQANDLAQARQNYENQRTNLNTQLSNLDASTQQAALQQYWAAVEAENNRKAQIAASRASVAQYLPDGYGNITSNPKEGVSFTDWIKNYSGWGDDQKKYWLNTVDLFGNGRADRFMQSAFSQTLPKTKEYQQYLTWRNQ